MEDLRNLNVGIPFVEFSDFVSSINLIMINFNDTELYPTCININQVEMWFTSREVTLTNPIVAKYIMDDLDVQTFARGLKYQFKCMSNVDELRYG